MYPSRYSSSIQSVTNEFLEIILEAIYLMHFGRNCGK